jgi:hypothetical protein
MRLLSILSFLLIALLLWTCQNIEDASPSKRNSFIKLYEGPYDITANDLEIVSDGYVVVGNMSVPPEGNAVDSIVTVVFKIDFNGNRIGDFHYYIGGSGKSIKQLPGVGYIIVGDRIKRDLNPEFVANGTIASARLLIIDEAFGETPLFTGYRSDNSGNAIKADYYGGSVTVDEATGDIIALGTYVEGTGTQINIPERPFIRNYTYSAGNLTENWTQDYDLIERNYKNGKSLHFRNNNIIWASAIARQTPDATFSYVSIPVVAPNSTFLNNSTIGEDQDQLFSPSDIQPSKSPGFGFGVVGTYSSTTDGSGSNMFFLHANEQGTIEPETVLFFDAILSKDNEAVTNNTSSEIIDEGLSITSTQDGGYVVAGSMETLPIKGNGGKDIFLVKVDIFGNILWNKTIGGSGDEVVSSIEEAPDGGLLICGTNTLGNASTVFLIKTDKNGELKN